jgi:chemotaxis protein CheC
MQTLDDDQVDCLSELINVAYGKATARLADVMGAFATMRPPAIEVIDTARFRFILREACSANGSVYLARQAFRGDVSGEVVFVLDDSSAHNITRYLQAQLGEQGTDDDDVLLELGNIVTASMMGELAAQMEARVHLSEPELQHLGIEPLSESPTATAFDHVIKIETTIAFNEQKIQGRVFVLTHSQCFEWIRDSLNRLLNELPG